MRTRGSDLVWCIEHARLPSVLPTEADRAYIRELMQVERNVGYHSSTRSGEPCRLRILGRGEVAFFEMGGRGLLLELLAGRGIIFARSIRRWGNGKRVTAEERAEVVEVARRCLSQLGDDPIQVVE